MIHCTIITPKIRELATNLNMPTSYVNNLVSVWQTLNNSSEYPTVEQLKELNRQNKQEVADRYFDVPRYKVESTGSTTFRINGNDIIISTLTGDKQNILSNYAKGLPLNKELQDEVASVIQTTNDCYMLEIWTAQELIEQGKPDIFDYQQLEDAYKYALNKLKAYKKNNPTLVIDNQNNVVKNPIDNSQSGNTSLVVTGSANTTAAKAKEVGGIDALRHPDSNGMHFGNPFSHSNYRGVQVVVPTVKEATEAFKAWLLGDSTYTTSDGRTINLGNVEPERRQWIVNQINNGSLVGKPIVYYTTKVPDNSYGRSTYDPIEAPNHAHILQQMIEDVDAMRDEGVLLPDYITEQSNQQFELYDGKWTRDEVAKQTDKVFLFGDNTDDRLNTHHIPSSTQAVIRGLPNAIGIDTKKDRGTEESSYFTDADFDTFKQQVDEAIQQAKDSGKTIVIPKDGIGTGKAELPTRAPKLFNYLQQELNKLQNNDTQTIKTYPTITESKGGYGQRTDENAAWSDVTLALARDFNTAGEKRTARAAGNKLIQSELPIAPASDITGDQPTPEDIPFLHLNGPSSYNPESLAENTLNEWKQKKLPTTDIKLNIAGNGIYSLRGNNVTQEDLNEYVTRFIKYLLDNGVTIKEIRSGGQTGIDEAGIIAAQKLGIPCSIHAPRGFLMRNETGKDVSGREAFVARFGITTPKSAASQPKGNNLPSLQATKVKSAIDEYDRWSKKNVDFHEDDHTYYYMQDGNWVQTTYTVSQYHELNKARQDSFFNEKRFFADQKRRSDIYGYAGQIGNDVDTLVRDFFMWVSDRSMPSPINKSYPNLTEQAKTKLIGDCMRLHQQFQKPIKDGGFGKNYIPIAKEIRLVSKFTENGEEVTIGGTMDMLIIDEEGNLHILDMKAKKDQTINDHSNREDYTSQLNGYKQMLEAIFPEFIGKIKDLHLIWFDQSYPQQDRDGIHYSIDPTTRVISMTDNGTTKNMKDSNKWITPHLNKDDVTKSLIPLAINSTPEFQNMEAIDPDWSEEKRQKRIIKEAITKRKEVTVDKVTLDQATNPNFVPTVNANIAVQLPTDTPKSKLYATFSPIVLKDRITLVSRTFSDIVDEIVDEKIDECSSKQEQLLQEITDIENSNLSPEEKESAILDKREKYQDQMELAKIYQDPVRGRQKAINDYTLKAILDRIKDLFQSYVDEGADELEASFPGEGTHIHQGYLDILDNFDALIDECALEIEKNENIRMIISYDLHNDGQETTAEQTGTVKDSVDKEDSDEEHNGDNEDGSRTYGNEGWSYKVRLVNPLTSLSKDVKRVLANIEKLDENGEPELDDLHNIRYINPEIAHAVLISELSDMLDADDFVVRNDDGTYSFPKLEALVTKYPWVQKIVDVLREDCESEHPHITSAFYTDFRKDFIPYWMQQYKVDQFGNGKWQLFQLNEATPKESVMLGVTRAYENGDRLNSLSIYKASKDIDFDNVDKVIELCDETITLSREMDLDDEEDVKELKEKTVSILKAIGFNTNVNTVQFLLNTPTGLKDLREILDNAKTMLSGLPEMVEDKNNTLIEYNQKYYHNIAELIGVVSDLDNVQSFRQNGKSYYSYSAPNYIDTMVKSIKRDDRRAGYLQEQFKQYDWFYKNNTWRCGWLEILENDREARDKFSTKELKFIGDKPYEEWDADDITTAFVREYFSQGINKDSKKQYAYYHVPIFSDSPLVKFIRFRKYNENYVEELLPKFVDVVLQEMDRIKWVQERKEAIDAGLQQDIANYDKNGLKFQFFPELNDKDLDFINNCRERAEISTEALRGYIADVIEGIINQNFAEFQSNISDVGMANIQQFLLDEGLIASPDDTSTMLHEYFWNQAYASTQIIQLTTTDLAYYKNDVDFQKRFKQVYASGMKLNTNSKYGKTHERVLYLRDQIITSSAYLDIKKALNKAVAEGRIQSFDVDNILNKFKDINVADGQAYRSLESMRSILDMMGQWTKEMETAMEHFEQGVWDMSDFYTVWQTVKPFTYTQIAKPKYTKAYLDKKLAEGAITQKEYDQKIKEKIKVPHQNKNSEFLLLATYSMIAGSVGASSKLRAMERFMQDNDIDVIGFESMTKVGGQGIIDITHSPEKLKKWTEEYNQEWGKTKIAAKKAIRKSLENKKLDNLDSEVEKEYAKKTDYELFKLGTDYLLDNDELVEGGDQAAAQRVYNGRFDYIEPSEDEVYRMLEEQSKEGGEFKEEVLHELPYNDYCVQQPTPEHLFDTEAVFGSQFRNLIISDLPEDFEVELSFKKYIGGYNEDGSPKFEMIKKKFNKQQLINLYQSTIIDNLLDDYAKVQGKFADIHTLQKTLLDQVKGNPKFSRSIVDALDIVTIIDENGNPKEVFNLPLDNPSTTLQLQEIVTSVFKNNIAKQKINGGACILVSDFGLTSELQILHNADGSISGIECYLPAYSKKFYEPFMEHVHKEIRVKNADGTYTTKVVDYDELNIEKMPEDLRKLVGYRIPTEDKYSMAPLIVKGFLPQQNGSAIMLPADITQIAGSDFDVDKMFLMIPKFKVRNKYNWKALNKAFWESDEGKYWANEIKNAKKQIISEAIQQFHEDPDHYIEVHPEFEGMTDKQLSDEFRKLLTQQYPDDKKLIDGLEEAYEKWTSARKRAFFERKIITKVEYDPNKEGDEQSRDARNNLLIDISYAILTSPQMAEIIQNPGNFDKAKLGARVARILSDKDLLEAFMDEYSDSTFWQDHSDVTADTDKDRAKKKKLLKLNAITIESIIKTASLEEVDEFIKKHRKQRSQLTLDTFIYNHRQNMTGGALIGVYANNTTMQAKYQSDDEVHLALNSEYQFNINGRLINRLDKAYFDITGSKERISKNCANFSAASVDNVKDPVLADLLQNMKTAGIAGCMLRAGMTVSEVSLLFSQPTVRACIEKTGGLSELKSDLADLAKEIQDRRGTVDEDIVQHMSFTDRDLIRNCMINTLGLTYEGDETEIMDNLQLNYAMTALMVHIVDALTDLNNLTHISRADSPKAAVKPSLAGAINQRRNVALYHLGMERPDFPLAIADNTIVELDYLTPNMTRKQMKEKLMRHNTPMLQAFFSLGIDLVMPTVKDYFIHGVPYMQELVQELQSNKGWIMEDKQLNVFFSEAITFALSGTTLFGDNPITGETYEGKREYYLNKFPGKCIAQINSSPELKNIDILRKLTIDDYGNLVLERSGRLTPITRESLTRDLDELLLDPNNKEAQDLAIELFMYSYYRNGFYFGPNSFGNFFSTQFIQCFPEVIDTLRSVQIKLKKGSFWDRYLPQFYGNHPDYLPRTSTKNQEVTSMNGSYLVNANVSYNSETKQYYPYMVIDGHVCKLVGDTQERAIYVQSYDSIYDADMFGRNVKVRYNSNATVEEISDLVKQKRGKTANYGDEQYPPFDVPPTAGEGISQEEFEALARESRQFVGNRGGNTPPPVSADDIATYGRNGRGNIPARGKQSYQRPGPTADDIPNAIKRSNEYRSRTQGEINKGTGVFDVSDEQARQVEELENGFVEPNWPLSTLEDVEYTLEQYDLEVSNAQLDERMCDDIDGTIASNSYEPGEMPPPPTDLY